MRCGSAQYMFCPALQHITLRYHSFVEATQVIRGFQLGGSQAGKSPYQDENEPHALSSHPVHQIRQTLELLIQNEVQLSLHVVDVCILDVLHGGRGHM